LDSIIISYSELLHSKINIALFQQVLDNHVDFIHIIIDNVLHQYNDKKNTQQSAIEDRNIFFVATIFVVE